MNNVMQGQGTLTCCDGRWYKGEVGHRWTLTHTFVFAPPALRLQWYLGKRHGFGSMKFVSNKDMGYRTHFGVGGVGTLYRIEQLSTPLCHLACPTARLSHPRYEGEWRKGHRTGMGTITYVNGDKYFGQFIDGRLNGTVRITAAYVTSPPVLQPRTAVLSVPLAEAGKSLGRSSRTVSGLRGASFRKARLTRHFGFGVERRNERERCTDICFAHTNTQKVAM